MSIERTNSPHQGKARSAMALRARGLGVTLVVAMVAALGGWIARSMVKSPVQAALEAEPPPPSVITAVVQRRVLSAQVVTRGLVRFGTETSVGSADLAQGLRAVLTRVPDRGTTINEGEVVLAIADRPMFVLQGELPLFRDLVVGVEGEDIGQLQQALVRLGLLDSPPTEVFGVTAWLAVRDLYETAGFHLVARTNDRDRIDQAEDVLTEAHDALALAGETASAAERRALEADEAAATSALADAIGTQTIVASSFLFLETVPVTVTETFARRGDVFDGEVLRIAPGKAIVEAFITPIEAAELPQRARATIEITGGDGPYEATVAAVERPSENGGSVDVRVVMNTIEDVSEFVGASVRVEIENQSTGAPVLVVPASAVSTSPDGSTTLLRSEADGVETVLTVDVGVAAQGFVEVTPLDGDLADGDLVVVGWR